MGCKARPARASKAADGWKADPGAAVISSSYMPAKMRQMLVRAPGCAGFSIVHPLEGPRTYLGELKVKVVAFEIGELSRFIVTGLTATAGNMVAFRLARSWFPFELSLVIGVAVGLAISFSLSKWFAFGSRSLSRTPIEALRFLLVYGLGASLYWSVAMLTRALAGILSFHPFLAENLSILVAAGSMAVVTYLGHRFFTYRTYLSVAPGAARGSRGVWDPADPRP